MKKVVVCGSLVVGCLAAFAGGVEIKVATEAELLAAPSKVMALPEAERAKGVTVSIVAGTYHLTAPVTVPKGASGAPASPVVWRSANPRNPARLVRSLRIAPEMIRPVTDDAVRARLPKAVRGDVRVIDLSKAGLSWPPPQSAESYPPYALPELFADGVPLKLATFPRTGWTTMSNIVDRGTFYGDQGLEAAIRKGKLKREEVHGGTFAFSEEAPARWRISPGLVIQAFWAYDWRDTVIPPKTIDPKARTITMACPHMYGITMGNPSPRRWRALNVLEEVREAGDYAFDTAKKLAYVLPPRGGRALTVCGKPGPVVLVDGAHDVTFRDLAFGESCGDGVEVRVGRRVAVERCTFGLQRHLAVKMHCDTRDSRVESCDMADTGTGGVMVSGGNRKTLEPGRNLVQNCRITRFSRRRPCYSSGITLDGVGNAARHNELTDVPHMAVSIAGNNHVFEYNVVSNVCNAADDSAGVYKGRNPSCRGNLIRWNRFIDIGAPFGHGTAAIYFDDGDCGDTVYGCEFVRCGYPGKGSFGTVFCNGGYSNRVENCIFRDCERALGHAVWAEWQWKEWVNSGIWKQFLLKDVDIRKPPYITAYPELKGFMEIQPKEIRKNVSENNVLIGCRAVKSGDWVTDGTTVSFEKDPGMDEIRRRLPAFKPIPFGEIGVKRSAGDALRAGFANPPDDAKLQVWWHWLSKSTTKKGVEADLKAMKEMEIATAHVFVPGFSGMPDQTGKVLSPEWMDVFKYAIARANHYGIRLGFHNCPGWSASGGPWMTADNSMQVLAASALDTDAASGALKLPDPPRKGFYEDVAVFAFPTDAKADVVKVTSDFGGDVEGFRAGRALLAPPVAKGEKGGTVTVEYASPVKARFAVLDFDCSHLYVRLTVEGSADGSAWKRLGGVEWKVYLSPVGSRYIALRGLDALKAVRVRFEHVDAPNYASNNVRLKSVGLTDLPMIAGIETLNCAKAFGSYWPGKGVGLPRGDMHDMTAKLGKDGMLDWRAPGPGRWRILRLGRASTGKFNSPADVAGYECDKLSKRGLAAHWPHMPRVFAELSGAKDAITTCIIDSFEAGGQNWTKDMVAEFRRRRGYDPTPYLPVVAGYAVGSLDDSYKFLEDFRRTVSDLFAENYYDYFTELCHREGWLAATEAYGGNFDGLRCWRTADIPMHEFWIEWKPGGIARSASAAHFNGAKYVGAESFTSWPEKGRWQITPRQLREVGDPQWVNGLNRIIIHSYMQQPYLNVVPGASMDHHGSHFNRNATWWRDGIAWSRYVARGQFLLQSGKPCAEVLAFDGSGHLDALLAAGYVYDVCSVDDLPRLANGPDGSLVTPSGMRYEMLFLGDRRYWPMRSIRELRRLAEGGARIAGNAPLGTNSLADDPAAWKREGDAFWNGHANVKACGIALEAVRLFGIRAPFDARGALRYIRRDIDGLPTYFVANLTDADYYATTTFASPADAFPEIWDAADGSCRAVPVVPGGRPDEAKVVLDVPAHRSIFVVFRRGRRSETATDVPFGSQARPLGAVVADLSTGWTVTAFDGKCPPSAPIRMDRLYSWGESADEKLKYFSGHATYEKRLVGIGNIKGRGRIVLDLGDVRDVANVYVDGRFVACLWSAPYEVDVTDCLTADSVLRIEVVNCWPNRMIGDALARKRGAAEPREGGFPKWVLEDRSDSGTGIYTWANWLQGWKADDRPLPAGLLGPVALRSR